MLCDSMSVSLHHFPELILNASSRGTVQVVPVDAQLSEPIEPSPGLNSDQDVVLATHGLTKDFKKLRAVDRLDLSVRRGDVFGFLGPNGAGKTTTIRLIFGLTYPTSGYVSVLGHRVPENRQEALRHMGGFVDDPVFYGNLTARRNLRMLGRMNGDVSEARVTEVLEMVGLSERGQSKVGGYSHGMRQRLGIALALIHRPDLIILDEPTSGLDPQGMKDVRELIRELGRQGTTVFLSSHLLHEVELVCNRAAILRKGRLVAQGPVAELHPTSNAVKVLTGDQGRALEVLRGMAAASAIKEDERYLVLEAGEGFVPEMVRRLVADQIDVLAVVPAAEQSLEDMFLELTSQDDTEERS
jgi:ABC-2 type transport system ATP-binding protein